MTVTVKENNCLLFSFIPEQSPDPSWFMDKGFVCYSEGGAFNRKINNTTATNKNDNNKEEKVELHWCPSNMFI